MLDLERRREKLNALEITSSFNKFLYGIIMLQILINMVLDRCTSIVMTLTTVFMIHYGLLRLTSAQGSMMDMLDENKGAIADSIFSVVIALIVTTLVLYMYHQDFMIAINQTVVLQEEIERVLENLDEAIICRSKQGISFCNNVGFQIL